MTARSMSVLSGPVFGMSLCVSVDVRFLRHTLCKCLCSHLIFSVFSLARPLQAG